MERVINKVKTPFYQERILANKTGNKNLALARFLLERSGQKTTAHRLRTETGFSGKVLNSQVEHV